MLITVGDLFDEADFGVATNGNPDEVVLGPETQKFQQPPTPRNGPNANRDPQGNYARPPARPDSAVVTPSKPERPLNPGPGVRQVPAPTLNARNIPSAPNPQQNFINTRPVPPGQPKSNQTPALAGTGGQVPVKREPEPIPNETKQQDMLPPGSSPAPPASFFSARAVDMLRDNSNPNAAPAFDPHAESPSIRKTAGVDHTKSVPISRPMLAAASPATNNTRDFVNPSADAHRRIGAPGASGIGSPMSRGPSTSSYRPLTRPNVDPRTVSNATAASSGTNAGNQGMPPHNMNGKRPPLGDVTNSTHAGGTGPVPIGINDPKRAKIADGSTIQPPPQPPHPQQ